MDIETRGIILSRQQFETLIRQWDEHANLHPCCFHMLFSGQGHSVMLSFDNKFNI